MLTIIHGNDIATSRNYYWTLKQKAESATTLDGIAISLTELQQALSGEDLFGNAKEIFIEDLLSKRKSLKELDSLTSLVQSSIINHQSSITLWESKELTKSQLKPFSHAAIKQFSIPVVIFSFLDNLKPGNSKILIEKFHEILKEKDPEFVLFMLERQVRMLLSVSSDNQHSLPVIPDPLRSEASLIDDPETDSRFGGNDSKNVISELSRLAPWQKSKLEKESRLFSQDQLVQIHSKLFQLELDLKTGGLSQSLENSLDFFLLSI